MPRASVNGLASSNRVRAKLTSNWTSQFKSVIEGDYVLQFLKNAHHDGVRFNGEPPLPDSAGEDLNQLFISYKTQQLELNVGRKALNFDNERFIGTVGFWQNEQTFDMAGVAYQAWSQSRFHYSYLNRANRIFGKEAGTHLKLSDTNYAVNNGLRPLASLGAHALNTHLWQFDFNEWDYHEASLYAYDIKNETAPGLSNLTTGLRYQVNYKSGGFKYTGSLNGAIQKQAQKPGKPQLTYLFAELGLGYRSTEFAFNYERLGAVKTDNSNSAAFITPLASLHEFQGWADQFTVTPGAGIRDYQFKTTWRKSPWKFSLAYHLFSQDLGSKRYGRELDFELKYKWSSHQHWHLRFARFDAASGFKSIYSDRLRTILSYSISLP